MDTKELIIEAKIEEKDMYHFLMHFVYKKLAGYVSLIFSIFCLIIFPFSLGWGDSFISVLLLFGGLLYTVITPLSFKLKAKQQIILNPVYKNSIHYTFNQGGLGIKQGNQDYTYGWSDLYKIEETNQVFLFFVSKKIAFILPKRVLKDKISLLYGILQENGTPKQLRLQKKTQTI
jgi:hypothetical protein